MRTAIRVIATALAVAVAAFLVPGIDVRGSSTPALIGTVLAVAVIIGLVNAFVKPIVEFFTGCLIWLTLGLFLLVVNALMLLLASWLAGNLGLGFHVSGFWAAVFGAIVISLVSGLVIALVDRPRSRRTAG
ncbi:phage holin family protein [Naumannella sp. ID2617S]|nr:phage holin family protein [Naumannella sp. ID2617S]